jgi:MOSC domain-containing protein YiiM
MGSAACIIRMAREDVSGKVVSVNVSLALSVERSGEIVRTGIFKQPIVGRVPLRGVNLRGDEQADRSVHGGPDRAVYAYASEDYEWWRGDLGRDLSPGKFGDNLTTGGVDVSGALVGERWRVGSAILQVTSPRVPCYKLALALEDPHFIRKFAQALRPGAYLSVVEEGDFGTGDPIEIIAQPSHRLSIAEMARIYLFERSRLADMLEVPELPGSWRDWVMEKIAQ